LRNTLSKSGHTFSATSETDSRPPFRIAHCGSAPDNELNRQESALN
jgi:hypothetical protein